MEASSTPDADGADKGNGDSLMLRRAMRNRDNTEMVNTILKTWFVDKPDGPDSPLSKEGALVSLAKQLMHLASLPEFDGI